MIINDQPFSLPRYCGISGAISMVEGPVCTETTVNNWCVHCMLSTASSESYHDGMFKLVHCHAQGLHCKVMRLPWNTELHVIFMNYLLKMLHVQWLNWSTVCLLVELHFCRICCVPFELIQLFCSNSRYYHFVLLCFVDSQNMIVQ